MPHLLGGPLAEDPARVTVGVHPRQRAGSFFASDFNNETNKKGPVSGIRTEQRRRASGGGAAGKKTAWPPSSRSPGPETEDQAPRAPQNQLFRPRKTHTARTLIPISGHKEPTSSA